jgi:nitrogenase iron protein NifH
MSKIAVYGKGGVGKSTIASNLSVAFAQLGERVLQVGCDPKHDSCSKLIGNYKAPTILDVVSGRNDNDVVIDDFMTTGYAGVFCVESGGPRAGEGCAGRGIARAFELLTAKGMLGSDFVDHVIFDVLGDVVCGGFAYPLRMGFSESVVVVISDDPMSIYAANNICHAISRNADNGVRLAGFVINRSCNIGP